MTLILDRSPELVGSPQTHALVIGVAAYPYVNSGPASAFGLGNLDAPVPSATAFTEFLMNEYAPPVAKLGTIDLLLSGGTFKPAAGPSRKVEEPNFDQIKSAFSDWYDRCNLSASNVGIFYFCGHGFDPGTMTLLCQDFGRDRQAVWDQAIDFDITYYAMADNAATTQCYFIDACREKPFETLVPSNFRPRPLRVTSTLRGKGRAAPVFKSALEGGKAQAPKGGEISFFTSGVLKSFRKSAAGYDDGANWVVTTDSLVNVIPKVMQRTVVNGKPALCTVHGDFNLPADLHVMTSPPEILATIHVTPDTVHPQAVISLVGGGRSVPRPKPVNPWQLDLPCGTYDVVTTFPAGAAYSATNLLGQLAYPPEFRKVVRVNPAGGP